jgi:light-regulated signal transduction histidine kinase (bacteriophytochrome)
MLWFLLVSALLPAGAQDREKDWDVTAARGDSYTLEFTTDEGTFMSVDVSPDGRTLVFDLLAHVYRVPVEGGAAECLTADSGVALNYHPRYSSMIADASQLQQIVLNLCVNARDAMPQGGHLRVSTRLLGWPGAGEPGKSVRRVELAVEDTGVGMDSKTLARLFEPFFSTKGEAGTGLGLSVVYGIVKSLDGDVGVKSSPGRGARFEVVLPCRSAEKSLSEGQVEEAEGGAGRAHPHRRRREGAARPGEGNPRRAGLSGRVGRKR